METEEDLPENMLEALARIQIAIVNNSTELNLSQLQLDSEQLADLLVIIKENIPNFAILNLKNNNLKVLPSGIENFPNFKTLYLDNNKLSVLPIEMSNLSNLEDLELENNELSELPVEIGNFKHLKALFLKGNNLLALPAEIGNLHNLEYLCLSDNLLLELPERLAELTNIEELNLDGNPLTQETINFLRDSFDDDVVTCNMAAHYVVSDYKEVLARIYGEKMPAILTEIETLDSTWTFLDAYARAEEAQEKLKEISLGKEIVELSEKESLEKQRLENLVEDHTLSAPNVMKFFLQKIPLNGSDVHELYFEGAKFLIDSVVGETVSDDDKKSVLYRTAKALGDCNTPVKDALIQGYMAKHINSNSFPKGYDSLVARAAVESEIVSQLRNKKVIGEKILGENEEIEQVQGLTNAIFMKGAAMNEDNKCKISFLADDEATVTLLFSKTAYPDFAFRQVGAELAVEFAKLCCKTDESGKLIKDKEGYYLFSSKKLRGIVEKYKKEGLGVFSLRERAISNYIQEIKKNLEETNLADYYDKPEVKELIDIKKQEQELREQLLEVPDSKIVNVAAKYLKSQEDKIENKAKSLKEENTTTEKKDLRELTILADGKRKKPSTSTKLERVRKANKKVKL